MAARIRFAYPGMSLRAFRIVVTGLILCAMPAVALDLPAESRFDAGLDGWTLTESGMLTWEPDGGWSGGFALFEDQGVGTGRMLAPAAYLGDWRALDGAGVLSWYHRIVRYGGVYQVVPPTVRLTGPGGVATWTASIIPDSSWTYVAAPIAAQGWRLDSGSWDALLANVTELAIQMELVDNSVLPLDLDGVDNVRLARVDPAGAADNSNVATLRIFPNPTRGEARLWFDGAGVAGRAGIWDARGRSVRRLAASSSGWIRFDGLDDRGRRLLAGVYFVRVETPMRTLTTKLLMRP
jgi:hypothetical protein